MVPGPVTFKKLERYGADDSHDPPLQSRERFVEAALLGPVALGDRALLVMATERE
jgi:hypothetical protein